MARYAEFAAELEHIVLYLGEHFANVARHGLIGQNHADRAVGLVDSAEGIYAQAILGNTRAIAKAGCSVIAGTCVNLAESLAHSPRSINSSGILAQ